MHKGEGLLGGGGQEGLMVATGGTIKSAQGNLGRYRGGVNDKAKREGNAVGDRGGDIGGRRAIGWRCWDGDGR